MRCRHVVAICFALKIAKTVATPVPVQNGDISLPQPTILDTRQTVCEAKALSSETWVEEGVDAFLADASQHYFEYTSNNIQALGAYLGAPNFFCGVNEWCNAGQPCSPVQLPGWYALMGIQGWNNYVNNLNLALTYTAAILGLRLSKLVADLWPKPKDNITKAKMGLAWMNGIINAFPTTAVFGAVPGGIASAVQGNNIIVSGMLLPPSVDTQFLRWTAVGDQLGEELDEYKKAINNYAQTIIDAPINDTKWGINTVLHGGSYLVRNSNFTQDDVESWMYTTVRTNAIGLILQAQNIFIFRVYNLTGCDLNDHYEGYRSAFHCQQQPNGLWTKYRLQKKGKDDYVPEHDIATKLQNTYGLTKEDIFLGPSNCFDTHDYEQLHNPWESVSPEGVLLDAKQPCNLNLNVCTIDAAENDHYGKARYEFYDNDTDQWCKKQGVEWS
ncbi:hypothetical protein CI238_10891 [Colletotrichum incanum]|uniref:DUF7872 domain-containing protein n=1 Tax=Colletotrichum incanum TaxID=1573173 RepID=A0A162NBD0_COLIC|nr:hypothetical protein CI238_10891 [Colletotrichum incanum]OHW96505.1 hypothetical protein CSPAE12_04839 [Colletotrichum incanum]